MRIRILKILIYWLIICNFAHCRTPCGCVDWNLRAIGNNYQLVLVAPRVGAWIETRLPFEITPATMQSHPVWVRGLKLHQGFKGWLSTQSHPVWVRGLKQFTAGAYNRPGLNVAPRVGAWIETIPCLSMESMRGRTPCGCVDWNFLLLFRLDYAPKSHPVWVRGLKHES